ncbi:MAG: 16S rRNA (cytosine(1402)-N(4))-methyltransferase RsmH [Mycobacteriales bacterium]
MSRPAGGPGPAHGHVPVLLGRVLSLLEPAIAGRRAVVVDATVGMGGHAEALLRRHPGLTLVGIDRDPEAIARSGVRLAAYAARVYLVQAVYDAMPAVLHDLDLTRVDGVLLDLGVSSLQFDERRRGFSYAADAALDMRIDPTRGHSAQDVVNDYAVADLARILREYGEERFARRIAESIDAERRRERIVSTARLADLVRAAIPAATRRTGGHPAKRAFQALRIEVNDELPALRRALPAAVDALAVGGRIVVLSYHSLEDREVKRALAARAADSTPPDLPVPLAEHAPTLRLLTKGPDRAGEAELMSNPRAASARLRAAERIKEAA